MTVEEPESHLHPRLQRALAELIVEVLIAQPSAQVMSSPGRLAGGGGLA